MGTFILHLYSWVDACLPSYLCNINIYQQKLISQMWQSMPSSNPYSYDLDKILAYMPRYGVCGCEHFPDWQSLKQQKLDNSLCKKPF
jgi:hypothetical protein